MPYFMLLLLAYCVCTSVLCVCIYVSLYCLFVYIMDIRNYGVCKGI